MESASLTPPAPVTGDGSKPFDKGLKTGAIGYVSNVVIAVASTAPAYSMAATLGFVMLVSGMGLQSPAIILIAFVPMLFISMGYKYLNQADPDCGTTFTWATRAFGPQAGWMGGWGIITSDVLVMASLAQIAALYTFHLWYANPSPSSIGVLAIGVAWIVVMTWICWIGIELSARLQQILLTIEVITLTVFAIVALVDVYSAQATVHAIEPTASWFNPFDVSSVSTLGTGVLVGIFIYWGWDSGVSVNEESENAATRPRQGGCAQHGAARADLSAGHDLGAGIRRHDRAAEQRERHLRVPRTEGLPQADQPASDHHGADVGVGIDPDHDPADRADITLDGTLGRDPEDLWPREPQAQDARRLDHRVRRGLADLVRRDRHPLAQQRAR